MKNRVLFAMGLLVMLAAPASSATALPQSAAQASAMTMSTPTTLQAERAADPKAAPARREGEGPFTKLIVRGVTLIDGTGGPPRGPVDIVIEGNRITNSAKDKPTFSRVGPVRRRVRGSNRLACNPKHSITQPAV